MLRKFVAPLSRGVVLLTLLLTAVLHSCRDAGTPDVSDSKVKLESRRFDQDFSALDTTRIGAGLQSLAQKYPDFLPFFTDTLLSLGLRGNYADGATDGMQNLRLFVTTRDYRDLLDTINVHFPDTKSIDGELEQGLKYYHHYFPEQFLPRMVYFPSFLAKLPVWLTGSRIIAIPLDMYLGPDYPYYDAPNIDIPAYAQEKCRPQYIPVNVFGMLYNNMYPFEPENKSLLEMMVEQGKMQYYLEKVLPFAEAETRLGMSKEQLKWCEDNEASCYNFFVQQNLLYSKDWQKIMRYVNDGPNASGFPAQAPANIGTWVGYRIVRAYAKRNADLPLNKLCAPSDAQVLLQAAQYKPR